MFTPGQQANSPAWACDYSNVDFFRLGGYN